MNVADRARRLVIAGAGAALLGAALAWHGLRRHGAGPAHPAAQAGPLRSATLVDDRHPLPDFALHSTAGELTRAGLAGRWSLLFFGYTHCPDVCPTTLGLMVELHRRIEPPRRPRVLFVSVDPARDTPELLTAYMAAFDAGFIGASGSDEAIDALTRHLGVHYRRNARSPAGFYTIDHTASIYLIDPAARLKAVFSPPHASDTMAADYLQLTG